MLKQIKAARENEKGFTLIELLIVIVILGVLAGIVVFAVSAFNNDGVTAACKSDVKNVEIASEAYFAKNSTWATAVDGTTATTLVGANYLKQAPPATKYLVKYTPGTATTEATVTGNLGATGAGAAC